MAPSAGHPPAILSETYPSFSGLASGVDRRRVGMAAPHASRRPQIGCGDDPKQMAQVLRPDVSGDGVQVLEAAVCAPAGSDGLAPSENGEPRLCLEGAGEQVAGQKDCWRASL